MPTFPHLNPRTRAHTQGCIRREGTSEAFQKRLGRRLEEVAKAVGGGYCRLQMPLKLALGTRGTVGTFEGHEVAAHHHHRTS